MDATLLIAALAGALGGFAASALPGVHVNALALLVAAAFPDAGEPAAIFLVAALAASPFGAALPATLVGPTEDLAGLPAHRLAAEGRAAEALAIQARGALLGILIALPLAFALRPAFSWLAPRLQVIMPWLLLAILCAVILSERRRIPWRRVRTAVPWPHGARRKRLRPRQVQDPHQLLVGLDPNARVPMWVETRWEDDARWMGRAAALLVALLAGALGVAALRLGARSPFGWPGSALLPLLGGLFAAPELWRAARDATPAPPAASRAPEPRWRELALDASAGALVAPAEGLAPGVSGAQAAMLLPRAKSPERALARLSAINGAAIVMTLLAWHALGKPRAGALLEAGRLALPMPWRAWSPPPEILAEAALVALAAALSFLALRALSGPMAKLRARTGPALLARGGIALLVACVWAFTGWVGLATLVAAALVGELPRRWRLRRTLGMASILVPAMLRGFGWA